MVVSLLCFRVLEIDETSGHVELSLKRSECQHDVGLTLQALKVNRCYAGVVRGIKDFGIFVELNGSRLSGLCHKTKVGKSLFNCCACQEECPEREREICSRSSMLLFYYRGFSPCDNPLGALS
mgnify:FL=1